MHNYASYCKRIGCFIACFLLVLFFNPKPEIAFAVDGDLESELNDNIDLILDDIDFDELEMETEIVPDLNLSFVDFVKQVLSGGFSFNYDSVFDFIKNNFSEKLRSNLKFFISLFIIVVIFEIFKSFSSEKMNDVKSTIKLIFLFLLAVTILSVIKNFYLEVQELVTDLFSFASILFPILISLLTMSGSVKSASVFSSFSVFLLDTGLVLLKYVLLPLAVSIMLLSLFGSVFSNGRFSKLIELFKLLFKYIIIIFFSVFGLLSTVNLISSAGTDGINLKLTKFAVKNYIPVLGGYVSEGFDFLYSCSILIKNAIGLCSIIIIIFKILTPVLFVIFFSLGFKVLSVLTGFVGDGVFSDMFDDVSKSLGNFLSVIFGSFLVVFVFVFLMILSVGVVWHDWTSGLYNFSEYNFWTIICSMSKFQTRWFYSLIFVIACNLLNCLKGKKLFIGVVWKIY